MTIDSFFTISSNSKVRHVTNNKRMDDILSRMNEQGDSFNYSSGNVPKRHPHSLEGFFEHAKTNVI